MVMTDKSLGWAGLGWAGQVESGQIMSPHKTRLRRIFSPSFVSHGGRRIGKQARYIIQARPMVRPTGASPARFGQRQLKLPSPDVMGQS